MGFFLIKRNWYLSYFSLISPQKKSMHVMGTHWKCTAEALLVSTNNIRFSMRNKNIHMIPSLIQSYNIYVDFGIIFKISIRMFVDREIKQLWSNFIRNYNVNSSAGTL